MEAGGRRGDEQRALVTGASAGIGAAFAAQLAQRGYALVLVARSTERLASTAERLRTEHGVPVEVLAADLAKPEDLRRVEQYIIINGALDLLVNNAGFGTPGSFVEIDADETERMIQVHVIALVRLTRAALPGMITRRRGAIINVSSLGAFRAAAPTYDATKAYVNCFTEAVQHEVAESGVRLQALCPGYTHTEFHARMGVDPAIDWGTPESWWMEAEGVAAASLAGLALDELICVPGMADEGLLKQYQQARDRLLEHAGAAGKPVARYRLQE